MSRELPEGMGPTLAGQTVAPALLGEFDFDSGTLYMWTGIGDLTVDGKTYAGGGNLINITPIQENQDLQAQGLVFELSGIPESIIAVSLTERTRGRPCRLYLALVGTTATLLAEDGDVFLTEDDQEILLENDTIVSPYRIFTGLMDTLELDDNAQSPIFRLSAENALLVGNRSKVKRYTSEEQKKTYSTDLGLDLINQLQDKEVIW